MITPQTTSVPTNDFFHAGSRALQDQADSRRIADRIAELRRHTCFSADDIAHISSAAMFFLATADASGQPDCSVKGGEAGFVQITGANTLRFPDYDGNGMFRSLGNITVNSGVGLLFVDFNSGRKMRINGRAQLIRRPTEGTPGGREGLWVDVTATDIFPNCPRYLPRMLVLEGSPHNPRPGHVPPPPEWKAKPELRDFLPSTEPASAETV
jgi:predicted pyridoxine 5'-phosphate oxidase superfamily flavin-nucleotide-binding protein